MVIGMQACLHIVPYSGVFVDNCSLNVRILADTDGDTTLGSQKSPISIRLEQEEMGQQVNMHPNTSS